MQAAADDIALDALQLPSTAPIFELRVSLRAIRGETPCVEGRAFLGGPELRFLRAASAFLRNQLRGVTSDHTRDLLQMCDRTILAIAEAVEAPPLSDAAELFAQAVENGLVED